MIDAYLDRYREKFDDGFPMYQLGRGRTDEEIIKIITECLEKGKDVYELGYLDEDDIEY